MPPPRLEIIGVLVVKNDRKMNKLEKLKGICVRGGEHGAEMIQAFVDAGARNNVAKHGGIRGDAYYFINNNDAIVWSTEPAGKEISLERLKEIVYEVDWSNPPKYVKNKTTGIVIPASDTGFFSSIYRLLTSSELAELEKELEGEKVEIVNEPIQYTAYQRLRIMGFKKLKIQDSVHKEKHGVNPFKMRKRIDKHTFFVWYSNGNENEVILTVCDVVVAKSNIEEVERIINLLK